MTPETLRAHAERIHREMVEATYPAWNRSAAKTREDEIAILARGLRTVLDEYVTGDAR